MLKGSRIILRDWKPEDALPFAQMNADAEVMRYFAKRLSIDESVAMLIRIREAIAENGWGLWALEVKGAFAGFVGLARPPYETPFTPCVEVGWRLLPQYWGNGFASEGAIVALLHGFEVIGLDEIVSFTTQSNERSQKVMQRIGMTRSVREDFDHPMLEPSHPLRSHCLYRIVNTADTLTALRRKLSQFSSEPL